LVSRTKKLLFKEDLPLKSSPMVVLSCMEKGAGGERDFRSSGMSQFTAVVVDWLLEDKIKRQHKSPDKRLNSVRKNSVRKVLRSRLLDNLGPLQEPTQLNDVDVLSRLIEATQNISPGIVVSAKPFESIYSKTSGKFPIANSVHLGVKSTLVTISREDLNDLIEKQIIQFYSELLSGTKGESFPKAIRIIDNLNRVQIREDVLRILERDFIITFLHDYKEDVDPWVQKYYHNQDFLKGDTEKTGLSKEPAHDLRGMLNQLIALSNIDDAQKFERFKKLQDIQQLSCLFCSFHEVKSPGNKDNTGEFEKLIRKHYEKCLEREKQQKGKSVGSKIDYLQAKIEA
jgi:hypothetical protein